MGIALRIVESPADAQPGTMHRWPAGDVDGIECWCVVLPNGAPWETTQREGFNGPRWTVTGTPPNITVTPSIDDQDPPNPWHGWIRNGVLDPA